MDIQTFTTNITALNAERAGVFKAMEDCYKKFNNRKAVKTTLIVLLGLSGGGGIPVVLFAGIMAFFLWIALEGGASASTDELATFYGFILGTILSAVIVVACLIALVVVIIVFKPLSPKIKATLDACNAQNADISNRMRTNMISCCGLTEEQIMKILSEAGMEPTSPIRIYHQTSPGTISLVDARLTDWYSDPAKINTVFARINN